MSNKENRNETTVAFFSDAPYVGGAERYIGFLASGIMDHGYKPVLIASGGVGLEPLKEQIRSYGAEIYELDKNARPGSGFAPRLTRMLRSIKPVVFHFNLPGPFDARYSLVAPIARLAGVRSIISTEHLPMVRSFPKGRVLKSFSTRFVSRVITVSEDNRKHLIGNHHVPDRKIRVVQNGIPGSEWTADLDLRRELGIGAESQLIAIVGALEERKGHATLLEALESLPASMHAVIVGDGGMKRELQERASVLGLSDRVHFTGYRNDVPSIMRNIDILVVPSSMEATPYVILEAMEAELPVIASSVFGIPEQVIDGETGILVPPRDVDELANAIRILQADPEKRKLMGKNALDRYQARFTLERSIRGTIEVYRESIRG